HAEVEQDRGRHDGDDAAAGPKADVAAFEVAHDAVGGGQSVGAAAGQADAVGALDGRLGAQQVGLAGAGPAAADVDAGYGPGLGQHHGAAGRAAVRRPMADEDAGNVG